LTSLFYWGRYDPDTHISEEIDTEDDRVEFLTSVATAMATRAKIKLNTKRLYAADGRAVKELLKVAEMLYSASRANVATDESEAEEVDPVGLPSQIKNVKGARALATDITERGARLFDLLGKERDVRVERSRALRFLDAISGNLDSTSEHRYVEGRARDLVAGLKETIEGMRKQCRDLEADEKGLGEKIKRKQAELERHEKRLQSLASVRPAFMDEYERLEKDLVKHYEGYLERFRNLDFLEHELDLYHKVNHRLPSENSLKECKALNEGSLPFVFFFCHAYSRSRISWKRRIDR
jgi:clusterin-associated protein 1